MKLLKDLVMNNEPESIQLCEKVENKIKQQAQLQQKVIKKNPFFFFFSISE